MIYIVFEKQKKYIQETEIKIASENKPTNTTNFEKNEIKLWF